MKYTEEDFSELVGLTYQAALSGQAGWSDFLEKLGEIGDGLKTFFLIQESFSNAANGLLYDGYDPEWIAAFEAYYAAINPTSVKNFGVGEVMTSDMMIDRAQMERSEFYNDWLKPQEDLIGCAALTVNKSAEQVFIIGSSIRRRDVDEKEAATARLFGLIKPHVLRVLEIQKVLFEQRLLLSTGAQSPPETIGIFVTKGHHNLIYANEFGLSLLREGKAVVLDGFGRFKFSDPVNDRAHHAAIPAIVHDLIGEVKWFEAYVEENSEFFYRCKVTPLHAFEHLPGALSAIRSGSAGLNVLTIEQTRMADDPVQALVSRFGLTCAEARVSLKLADGQSVKAIAEAHSVSPVTVRNQIKSAMSKAGVHRQTELALKVLRAISPRL
ncbi:helix-turn-helix transcriptional regulator [Leisingera aquaemixtae]|uniref:helix-turn-helix transcriptional regulator n=1 Tax=Leisingera aquaemixtae TaxID=1396826 RepID=UPI003983FFA8